MYNTHPDFETKIGGKKCVLYTGVYATWLWHTAISQHPILRQKFESQKLNLWPRIYRRSTNILVLFDVSL